MDLIIMYLKKNIGNINRETLESILRGENTAIKVKSANHGIIILNNNQIIKCVSNYYSLPDQKKIIKRHNNSALTCNSILNTFDINSNVFQCVQCHIQCMNKERNKELKRVYA